MKVYRRSRSFIHDWLTRNVLSVTKSSMFDFSNKIWCFYGRTWYLDKISLILRVWNGKSERSCHTPKIWMSNYLPISLSKSHKLPNVLLQISSIHRMAKSACCPWPNRKDEAKTSSSVNNNESPTIQHTQWTCNKITTPVAVDKTKQSVMGPCQYS